MALKITKNGTDTNERKTLEEKAKEIFKFLEEQKQPIYKSSLEQIGLSGSSVNKWLDMLMFLQEQFCRTTLVIAQAGRYTTIALEAKEPEPTT